MAISITTRQTPQSIHAALNRQTEAKIDRACAEAYARLCTQNELSFLVMTDAVEQLKERGWYRQRVKHNATKAWGVVKDYQRKLHATLDRNGSYQYYMDLADFYCDEMRPHVDNLRYAIKAWLDKRREEDTQVKSYVLTAEAMLQYNILLFDTYFKAQETKTGVDIAKWFLAARMDKVKGYWSEMCDALPFGRYGIHEMEQDPQCDLAVRCIMTQGNNNDVIERCGLRALEYNPEMKERIKDK